MEKDKVKSTKKEMKMAKTDKLNPLVWEVPYNEDLLAQVLYIYNSNERKGTATVKGRGEVSGGGKKPWKQKGTGRARHGSSRSPIWVGGGVTFGNIGLRNYSKKMNAKMAKKALCVMLSERLRKEDLEFVSFDSEESKEIRNGVISKFVKSVLVISDNENVKKSIQNVESVKIITPMKVNAKHVMTGKKVLVDKEVINILENRLTNGK